MTLISTLIFQLVGCIGDAPPLTQGKPFGYFGGFSTCPTPGLRPRTPIFNMVMGTVRFQVNKVVSNIQVGSNVLDEACLPYQIF